jgi:hypothetical protein
MTDTECAYAQRQGVYFAIEAMGGPEHLTDEQAIALNELISKLDKRAFGKE